MGRMQRDKGARFERELVHRFAEVMPGCKVKRGLQSREGADVPDVDAPPFWVEAKHRKQVSPGAALEQAQKDMEKAGVAKGRIPVAVIKKQRKKPFVVMDLDDFLEVVAVWWEGVSE